MAAPMEFRLELSKLSPVENIAYLVWTGWGPRDEFLALKYNKI